MSQETEIIKRLMQSKKVGRTKTKFENIRILYPESYLGNHFFELCHPIFQKILILSKENQYLQQARDRLLPKLMSGEVEV